jgi:hypothetical protein
MAVCDLDAHRVEDGKKLINDVYAKKTGKPYDGVTGYAQLPRVAGQQGHRRGGGQHAGSSGTRSSACDAVRAGKDVYLQKPASLTIAEGRALSNTVQASGRILQIGSQQRSTVQFRYAAELVRNGRIGDCSASRSACRAIPPAATTPHAGPDWFNYEMWLGETPEVYYTEIACIRNWATTARAGCAAASLARA